MVTGAHARDIARQEGVEQALVDDAFTAGMLHDVGTLVLATNLPDQYTDMLAAMQERGLSEWDAERAVFGATHAEVGGYLLDKWNLGRMVVDAVAYHHEPARCANPNALALAAVHVANVVEEEGQATAMGETAPPMDLDYLTGCGLADRIPLWQALCRNESLNRTAV
jgi:HD-like signal output (HDOD) protein